MKNDDVLDLIRSHVNGNRERFRVRALAIAANAEASSPKFAKHVRGIIDSSAAALMPLPSDVSGLLTEIRKPWSLDDMVLDYSVSARMRRVIEENAARDTLAQHGLSPLRKLLFVGPPGVGKTMAASALGTTLHMPVWMVNLHAVIASHLGETAGHLSKVFRQVASCPGVYLFDEVDALAPARADNRTDVAEMRRVVNSLLQMIEMDESDSLIIATTNNAEIMDRAIFRRFDDIVHFPVTDEVTADRLIKKAILTVNGIDDWEAVHRAAEGMGHADLVAAVRQANKDAVIDNREVVWRHDLVAAIEKRRGFYPDL